MTGLSPSTPPLLSEVSNLRSVTVSSDLVRGRLEVLARSVGVGERLPKARDLCRDFAISRRTLDEALGDLEKDGIIERKHGVGIFVAKRPIIDSHLLLICHPDFFNSANHSPFWRLIVEGVRQRADERGGSFDIHFSRPDGVSPALSPSLLNEIEGGGVAGVLGLGLATEVARWIEGRVPLITLAGWSSHIVGFDLPFFMRQGIETLQAQNCRRIGFWNGFAPHRHHGSEQRFIAKKCFETALRESGLPLNHDTIWDNVDALNLKTGITEISLQEQGFTTATNALVKQPRENWPDGIVVNDELVMQGALRALNRANIQIGHDIQIVTHSNAGSQVLLDCEDTVFQLQYAPEELVAHMFTELERLIVGDETVPAVLDVKTKLIPPRKAE